jgi:cysteine-S-conjugate beta-lyase
MAAHPWDELGPEHFLAQGSLKWTTHKDATPAFVAEMDFPVADVIVNALRDNLAAERFGYLPEHLAATLSSTVQGFLEREFSWRVPESRVYPVADVLVAYDAVLQELVAPGAPVIVPTPAYMPFLSLTPLRGHPVIEVPFMKNGDRWVFDLERIEKEFLAGAGMMILCNPHNPLGLVHTEQELLALAEVVDRVGGLVFSDEIHSPLVFDGHHIPYASVNDSTKNHTITAISASKAWNLAGLKCAQLIVTSDDHHKTLSPKKFMITHGASTPGVEASIAAYRDGGKWLTDAKNYIRRNIDLATSRLHDAYGQDCFTPPHGTYIGWLDLRHVDPEPHGSVADLLLHEARVAVTDGAKCGEVGRGHVRIILATTTPILDGILSALISATAHRKKP